MKMAMQSRDFLERLLARTGGWFVAIAIVVAQFAASITMFLGFISEQLNADYAPEVIDLLNKVQGLIIPIVIILQILIALILSRNISTSLNNWKKNPEIFRREDNGRLKTSYAFEICPAATIISFSFISTKTLLLAPRSCERGSGYLWSYSWHCLSLAYRYRQ
jgi:hypothetical protein